MQMEFDWARRKRCAQRTDASLALIGVSTLERAVIRLLLEHHRAEIIDSKEKVVALAIGYREAAQWMRQNINSLRDFAVHHEPVRRAVGAWRVRGVLHTCGSAPTRIAAHFGRLTEWYAAETDRPQAMLFAPDAAGALAQTRTTRTPSKKERKKERINHSFFQKEDPPLERAQGCPLPPLPPEWYARLLDVDERRRCAAPLVRTFVAWWQRHRLLDQGFDPLKLFAAIAACIERKPRPPEYPDAYIARLYFGERGPDEAWLAKARKYLTDGGVVPASPTDGITNNERG